MADMQTYSHSDIDRYLQHNMSPQEMHDFEKALMNDPFLADALEGFSAGDAAVTEKHLSEIEREIIGAKQKVKVVPMQLQKTAWWKVAAVVLAVVSFGVLTYSLFTKKGAEKIVVQKMSPEKATQMAAKPDSLGPVEKPLAQVDVLPKKEIFKHKKASPLALKEKEVPIAAMQMKADSPGAAVVDKSEKSSLMNRNADVVSAFNTAAHTNAAGAMESKKMATSQWVSEYVFEGRVADTTNQPLTGAIISVPQSNIKATVDSNGYFILKAKDSVLQINVSAIGYVPTQMRIKRHLLVNVVLDKSAPSLSELVVSDLVQKNRKSSFGQLNKNTKVEAEPEGGWENFEQYLHRQTDSLKANDIANSFDEKIELEFSIDKEGRPTDIKVLVGAENLTAEKAIQILANGPKWKNKKKDEKVKIIMPFE